MEKSKTDIKDIVSNFRIQGAAAEVLLTGSGLINDTYRVINRSEGAPDYLLQRINHHIFRDITGLMKNIVLITSHIKEKISGNGENDTERRVLNLVPLHDGKGYFCQDKEGNYWRMYHYIPGARSYDIVRTEKQAYEGGKAFGRFQYMLSDLDASLISESIPDFHNIEKRLSDLERAIATDPLGRVSRLSEEIGFVIGRRKAMCMIPELGRAGKLKKRINHCDTKFNNVLLDEKDEALCVIDLDTVMPGYVACDFGDAIRSIINTAAEDEKDLNKIQLNIPLFRAYTSGYFSATHNFLTKEEVSSLINGVMLLPYMQAVRFLTDYIGGDLYYKISFAEHNLQRTRAQIQLVKKLEENYELLERIIREVAVQYDSSLPFILH